MVPAKVSLLGSGGSVCAVPVPNPTAEQHLPPAKPERWLLVEHWSLPIPSAKTSLQNAA